MSALAIFSKWTQTSLRRLAIAGALIVAPLGTVLVLLSVEFSEASERALEELRESNHVERTIERTLQLLVDGETGQRGFLIAGDAVFLEPVDAARPLIRKNLQDLREVFTKRRDLKTFSRFEELVTTRVGYTDEVVSLGHRDIEQARERVRSLRGKHLMDRVRLVIHEMTEREERQLAGALDRVQELKLRAEISFGFLVLVGTVIAGGLAWSVGSHLRHAANEVQRRDDDARRFNLLADSASDLVRVHALDGRLEYVNPACSALLGYQPEEMRQLMPLDFIPEADLDRVRVTYREGLTRGVMDGPFVHGMRRKDGVVRQFETRLEFMRDDSGTITRFSALSRDITERRLDEERLTARAERDELTGLYNRRAFLEKGAALIARCQREQKPAVLAFCDVDGLKQLNDSMGHEAGDGLIRDAGLLLQNASRETDLVARLGGDEFVVLGIVRDATGADAFRVRLYEKIEEYNAQSRRLHRVAMSVGISVLVAPFEQTLEALLLEADAKMYAEKKERRAAQVQLDKGIGVTS